MSVIDEVKQKTDITEIIGQYATLKKAGKNLTALCPFHSEKHPSFFVYPEQQSWHCFGACNTGGDVLSFIMRKESMEFGEALRLLADRVGVVIPSYSVRAEDKEEKEEFYKINEATALYYNNLLINSPGAEKARAYVEGRGFSSQTVSDFQLGFSLDRWEELKKYLADKGYSEETMLAAGLLVQADDGKTHDRFRGKLMFPIRDNRGRTTGFGARVLDDSLPKYVNSPQTPTFDKSSILYGIDRAASAIRKQDMAIIMEGYMDVITAHQNGITNAVASMGTAVTESQANALKKLSKNLYFAFDADVAGIEASGRGGEIAEKPSAEDTAYRFSRKSKSSSLILNDKEVSNSEIVGIRVINEEALNVNARVIKLPKDKDPDDIIREDVNIWQSMLNKAVPLLDFMFEKATIDLDLSEASDKSIAVDKLLPIVVEIKDPIRQAHYMQKLAKLVNVDIKSLEEAYNRMKSPQIRRKIPERKPAAIHAVRSYLSSTLEEYALTLLLQYPEMKNRQEELSKEYFEISENREIYNAWQDTNDISIVKEALDPALHEHYDKIINRKLPTVNNIDQRFTDSIMELRKKYLKNLAARKAESGEQGEEDIEISAQLREVYSHKNMKRREARR